LAEITEGGWDLAVLDGEAGKLGGMGLARMVRDEVDAPPPMLLVLARPQDAWLATWSGADASIPATADAFEVRRAVTAMLGAHA
jgi:DNA-binding response OmpR family regulator